MDPIIIFSIAILIMSVVIHEVAHGYAALWLGDVTAKYAGRLTLNPIKHIDPFGSVILPVIMALLPGNFIFGWAKPVPYNPYNLRNQRWGELIVAIAGPASNILVAIFFGLLIRFSEIFQASSAFIEISYMVVMINLILAVFNMMPIPPLDGSKVLFSILPLELGQRVRAFLETYGLFILIFFILFLWEYILLTVLLLAYLLTGISVFNF